MSTNTVISQAFTPPRASVNALAGASDGLRMLYMKNKDDMDAGKTRLSEPAAQSSLPGGRGVFQYMAFSDAISEAVDVLDKAREGASTVKMKQLNDAIAHLQDSTVPRFGVRVDLHLTALGAIHAALVSERRYLMDSSGDAERTEFLAAREEKIAAEIINIGTKAAKIGKGGRDGGKPVHGGMIKAVGGAKEDALRKAIEHSDKALRECRKAVGDELLFRGLATGVMARAMHASLSERRPDDAKALVVDGDLAALTKMIDPQGYQKINANINRALSSGGAADFRAALFCCLELPEHVIPAGDNKAVEAPPEETPDPPFQGGPDGLGGMGHQMGHNVGSVTYGHQSNGHQSNGNNVGVGGDKYGNVVGNNNATIHNHLGDLGKQFEGAVNLGVRLGRRMQNLKAENTRLRTQLQRARSNRAQVQRDLRQRVETIKAQLAKPRGAGVATMVAAPTPAKAAMPTSLMTTVMVRLAETMPAMAVESARVSAPLALPAPPPPRAMDEVLAQLRVALDGWWAREGAPVEAQQGVADTPSVRPSLLGSRAPISARHWQSPDSPAEAVLAELKRSFAQLPAGELPTPGQMLALHGRVARLVGPGAPHATLESAIEELRQGVAAPVAVTAAEPSAAFDRQQPRTAVPLPLRRVVTAGDVLTMQPADHPDRRVLRRSGSLSSIERQGGQLVLKPTAVQQREPDPAPRPASASSLAAALKQSFSSLPAGEFPSPIQVRGAPVDHSRIRTQGPRTLTPTEQFVAELVASPLVARHATGPAREDDASDDESSISGSMTGSDTESLSFGNRSEDDDLPSQGGDAAQDDRPLSTRDSLASDAASWESEAEDDGLQQLLHEATNIGKERFHKLAGPRYGLSAAQRDAVVAQLWPAAAEDDLIEDAQAFLAMIEEENARPKVLTLPKDADVEAMVRHRAELAAPPPPPDGDREGQIDRLVNTVRHAAQNHAEALDGYANTVLYPEEKRWLYQWSQAAQPAAPAATFRFAASEEDDDERDIRRGSERSQRLSMGSDSDAQAERKKQLARDASFRSQASGVSVQS